MSRSTHPGIARIGRMLLTFWACTLPIHALDPANVLILVNRDTPISSEVARMYQHLRQIPPDNILRLHLGESRYIQREQYRTRIALPIKQYLEEHAGIQCILTTAGVPYVIQTTPGTEDGAAVDNELAAVLREEPKNWNRWQPNPLFLPFPVPNPRSFQMVYIARLDGPNLQILTRMVQDAIATEAAGFSGPVFGDAMGLDGKTGMAVADSSIRGAIDRLAGAGFPAVLDMNQADWRPPPGGVGEQAAGAAFYLGWYSLQKFQDIFGRQGLARGAIAWHIASGEAVDIWNLSGTQWCVNLMRRGAAVTIGPVFEPYVSAFPKAEVLVESLLAGRTIAESYWQALPHVSWAMVLLGDPLYRPFALKPKPALVARAYVGAGPSRVLEKGQSGPVLVQVQCVGPAGSGTPAYSASVESESGLKNASGIVVIPHLEAGQVTTLRIPSITAGDDATGMFRLRLNVQNLGETTRRIVVEGRTGFSKVAGLMASQTQMFVSPKGLFVISGFAGNTILTDTSTLQSRRVTVPAGWQVIAASFSPDEAHLLLALMQPEQKQLTFLLADSGLQHPKPLPEGTQDFRWMDNDTILLRKTKGLVKLDIATSTELPIFEPDGWTVNTMIPGTAIQMLSATGERVAVRNGAGTLQEVLSGVKITQGFAVADDLSMFGAVDDQKRLWIQHGVAGRPEIVAEQVEKILWGPISRRMLVQEVNDRFRVYDGRSRSWTQLPPLLLAQWSPNEEELLYVEAERQEAGFLPRYLSLLAGSKEQQLCDIGRLGDVGAITFADDGKNIFVLAGPEGAQQVWLMALPTDVK